MEISYNVMKAEDAKTSSIHTSVLTQRMNMTNGTSLGCRRWTCAMCCVTAHALQSVINLSR